MTLCVLPSFPANGTLGSQTNACFSWGEVEGHHEMSSLLCLVCKQVSGTFPMPQAMCCKGTPFQPACGPFYRGAQNNYDRTLPMSQSHQTGMSWCRWGGGRGEDWIRLGPSRLGVPATCGLREKKGRVCGEEVRRGRGRLWYH